MDYHVSEELLEDKFIKWRDAMLMELQNSLNLSYDINLVQNFEIDSVLKYNLLLSGITGLLHTRFRGEARYHSNPGLPIIARKDIESKTADYEIEEINRFKKSDKGREFESRLARNDITWWMLTQHYKGYETRLLDISRNSLIALYFACEKHFDKDGYVFIFHSINKMSLPLNDEYKTFQDHIVDVNNYYKDDHYVYMHPTISLDRINRQEGEFLWIRNFSKLKHEGFFDTNQIIPIIIKKENKQKLLRELNDPQGINNDYLNIKNIRNI